LTSLTRELIGELSREYYELLDRIKVYEKKLDLIYKNHPEAQRLTTIPGVGKLGATAIIASVTDPHLFKNGREFAAWLGLVPKQSSSGGKQRMLGISKRGDNYIRRLLIHGSRASLRWMGDSKVGKRNLWAQKLKERRGYNRTAVALANKNARIVWALLTKQENYKSAV